MPNEKWRTAKAALLAIEMEMASPRDGATEMEMEMRQRLAKRLIGRTQVVALLASGGRLASARVWRNTCPS